MATPTIDLMQRLAIERLEYLRAQVMEECLPRWYSVTDAWREQNRHAPVYALRATPRTHVITIEWMHIKYWTHASTGRRRRTFTSLPRGNRWAYDRSSFKLANDSQWGLIESIEREASRLRFEMTQLMILRRHLRSLEMLAPNRKR